jgi:hypothetical protein
MFHQQASPPDSDLCWRITKPLISEKVEKADSSNPQVKDLLRIFPEIFLVFISRRFHD